MQKFTPPIRHREVQLCRGGGCDQEDSPSVWSGSCTSCQEFADRPGTKAPPSGRSLSPGRTTGPASGRSWNVIIKINPSTCDMQLYDTADLWSWDTSGNQSPQQSSLPCRANSVSQDKHRAKLKHCDFWATANITLSCGSADYFVGLFVSQMVIEHRDFLLTPTNQYWAVWTEWWCSPGLSGFLPGWSRLEQAASSEPGEFWLPHNW